MCSVRMPDRRLNLLTYLRRRETWGYTNRPHERTHILLVGRYADIDWYWYE